MFCFICFISLLWSRLFWKMFVWVEFFYLFHDIYPSFSDVGECFITILMLFNQFLCYVKLITFALVCWRSLVLSRTFVGIKSYISVRTCLLSIPANRVDEVVGIFIRFLNSNIIFEWSEHFSECLTCSNFLFDMNHDKLQFLEFFILTFWFQVLKL